MKATIVLMGKSNSILQTYKISSNSRSVIVRVQMLAELEEIIVYKLHNHDLEKQETMRRTWTKRYGIVNPCPQLSNLTSIQA